jgi:hypothetical protein
MPRKIAEVEEHRQRLPDAASVRLRLFLLSIPSKPRQALGGS